MEPKNLLFIMSDEHNPKMLGCAGHSHVKTPNLDALAASGTRFTAAYSNSPICIPARAAWATGRYVHDIGYWDNALAYDGRVRGWGHHLIDLGFTVESVGKLHYRNETDPTGFSTQRHPMHIMGGIGQVWGSVRDPLPLGNPRGEKMLGETLGPGESKYNIYDRTIADTACEWLEAVAARPPDRPWVLYLGFVAPHFPLVVPREYYDMYPIGELPPMKLRPEDGYERHPWADTMARFHGTDEALTPHDRKVAQAAYFGLCTYVDAQIGRVLDTLKSSGLAEDTRIVYTSDHGDNVGARGLWGKSNMYEEAAGIPLMVAGPDVPEGRICRTTVSLVDSYQTILDGVGVEVPDDARDLPGRSWFRLAGESDEPDRIAFSEYHAAGSPSGAFMVRRGRWKYIYYVGFEPELFDLEDDPEETANLAGDAGAKTYLDEMHAALLELVDPEAVDRRAKDDQNELVAKFGGPEAAFGTGTKGATPAPV